MAPNNVKSVGHDAQNPATKASKLKLVGNGKELLEFQPHRGMGHAFISSRGSRSHTLVGLPGGACRGGTITHTLQ